MKKLSLLFTMGLVASSLFLSSCGDDEDDVIPNPTIDFIAGNGFETADFTTTPGAQFTVVILAQKADKNLKEFNISRDGANLTGYPEQLTGGGRETLRDTITITVPLVVGAYNYEFTVTDNDNLKASRTLRVTVAGSATIQEFTGKRIYNRQGTQNGAFDLVNNVSVASASNTGDMQDNTGLPPVYQKGWTPDEGSNTTFVQQNNYDYDSASQSTAATAFASGTINNDIRNVVAGDIFIARLRGGSTYAIIKITQVNDNGQVGVGLNDDYIQFDYKK